MILKNVCIIDCTGRDPYPADLRIEQGKIAEIGTGLEGPDCVDAGGRFLIPGLINLHVHINRRHLSRGTGVFRQGAPAVENSSDAHRMLYAAKNAWYALLHGVTTLRDLSSVGRTASELKAAIESGLIRGPRMVVCGLGLASTGGHETHRYPGAVEADGVDEVMKAARNEIRLGADFIKVMASGGLGGMPEHEHPGWSEYTVTEIRAITEVAHSHNRIVTVHAMGDLPVKNSLLGGVDCIEHGAVLSEESLQMMRKRNVFYVPTASGITAVAEKERKNGSEALASMMEELVVLPQRESIKKAHEAGITIGAGTDTLGTMTRELQIFESCGLSRLKALQTATRNAAVILGKADRFGTVEVGKEADLVLLNSNPLQDLRAIEDIEAVYFGGEKVSEAWMCHLQ